MGWSTGIAAFPVWAATIDIERERFFFDIAVSRLEALVSEPMHMFTA